MSRDPVPLSPSPSSLGVQTANSPVAVGVVTSPTSNHMSPPQSEPSTAPSRSYFGELYSLYFNSKASLANAISGAQPMADDVETWILGRPHNGPSTTEWVNANFSHVSYFTYRNRLPFPLNSAGLDYDSGWGCMIRTGQMMLSEALRRTLLSGTRRQRSDPLIGANERSDSFGSETRFRSQSPSFNPETPVAPLSLEQLHSWFRDTPDAPFGLPAFTRAGLECARIPVGEWFSSTAVALVVARLVAAHAPVASRLAVAVARDGVVAREDVLACFAPLQGGETSSRPLTPALAGARTLSPAEPVRSPAAPAAQFPTTAAAAAATATAPPPGRRVLLLVPLMLGIGSISPDYWRSVLACLELRSTLGVVGGKPKMSLYFVGHQQEHVFYLDPHVVQPAFVSEATAGPTSGPRGTTKVGTLDPCLLLSFLFATPEDFAEWEEAFTSRIHKLSEYPMFSVVGKKQAQGNAAAAARNSSRRRRAKLRQGTTSPCMRDPGQLQQQQQQEGGLQRRLSDTDEWADCGRACTVTVSRRDPPSVATAAPTASLAGAGESAPGGGMAHAASTSSFEDIFDEADDLCLDDSADELSGVDASGSTPPAPRGDPPQATAPPAAMTNPLLDAGSRPPAASSERALSADEEFFDL